MNYHGTHTVHGVTTRHFTSHRCVLTARLVSNETGGHYVVLGGTDLPRKYEVAGPVDVDSVDDGKHFIAATFDEIADALGARMSSSRSMARIKTKDERRAESIQRRTEHSANMRDAIERGDYNLAECYGSLVSDANEQLQKLKRGDVA